MPEAFQVEVDPNVYRIPPGEPSEPPERFSMSYLDRAAKCHLAAHLGRVSDPSGEPAVIGNVIHDALAAMGMVARAKGVDIVGREVGERAVDRVLKNPSEPLAITPAGVAKAREIVGRIANSYAFPVDADECEFELNSRIDLDGHTLSARIDQAAKRGVVAEVDDWKTGQLPNSDAVLAHVQLPIYAYHLSVRWPDVERFVMRERYIAWGGAIRPDPPIELTREDLANVEDWLRVTVARVEAAYAAGELRPTPGSWCAWCPAKMACPLPADRRLASTLDDDNVMSAFASLLVGLEQADEAKAAIRAWLEANEVEGLTVGDKRIGFTVKPSRSFDKKRALADLGASEDDYTTTTDKTTFAITKAASE